MKQCFDICKARSNLKTMNNQEAVCKESGNLETGDRRPNVR